MTDGERPEIALRPTQGRSNERTPASRLPRFDAVDEASASSFPASDPPPWSAMRAGPPRERDTSAGE
jgi:hypothetical protein